MVYLYEIMKIVHEEARKAFVVYNDRILLLRESSMYNSPNQGKWDVPGVRLEHGEDPLEALKREVNEEAGISAVFGDDATKPLWVAHKSYTGHGLGAGSATEIIITLKSMQEGVVIPIRNLTPGNVDERFSHLNLAMGDEPIPHKYGPVLKLANGFGAQISGLVLEPF